MEPGKFPGPLYPPDAAPGHPPSKDSPFVLAVKRWAAHLGAWPWDPNGWDDSYSNRFAHGGDPDTHAGVAGVQRWAKITPASGWFGEGTFNFARSVLIPEGRDNAGIPAWDSVCQSLTAQAYEQAHPPPAPDRADPREVALDHMQARLGYTEDPANSNCDNRPDGIRTSQDHTADGTWLRGQAWCGCWCFYALESAGVQGIDSSLASVPQIHSYALAGQKCYRGWTGDRAKVKPGDLVVMGNDQHVEMVRGFDGSTTLTYGGNTSPGTSGSQSNGGGAYARYRYPSEVTGYALIRYPGE
jgi:hypothetical protein